MTEPAAAPSTRPVRSPSVEWAYLAPDAVVYAPASKTVAHLNGPAGSIWMLIDGSRTTDELVSELAEFYGVQAEQIGADVEAALADFARRGLLALTPRSP